MEEEEEIEEINFEDTDVPEFIKQRIDSEKIYTNYLTQTEFISIIGRRADMIHKGSPIFIDTKETDTYKIAILELIRGKCPLSIEKSRGIYNGEEIIEIHDVNEMILSKKCISTIQDCVDLKDNFLDLKEEIKKFIDDSN